jgi:spermidine synthase
VSDDWFEETLYPGVHSKIRITRQLHRSDSGFQSLNLFENERFGRVLTLDGVVQTTEADEFIYHEMLTHVPILAHGQAREIMVIGGGDGGVIEEVLKHASVMRVTLVEIDPGVIEFSRKYLGKICGEAFDDPRTNIVIADGLVHAETTGDRYDVVVVDSTDPIGPGEALFSDRFYRACRRCAAPGGILVTQNGVPFMQPQELAKSVAAMRRLYGDATCYTAAVPTYVGGCMAFGWATDNRDLRKTDLPTLQSRFDAAAIDTRYYTPAVHQAAFALPRYIGDLIA